jgi:hypothetical protein
MVERSTAIAHGCSSRTRLPSLDGRRARLARDRNTAFASAECARTSGRCACPPRFIPTRYRGTKRARAETDCRREHPRLISPLARSNSSAAQLSLVLAVMR